MGVGSGVVAGALASIAACSTSDVTMPAAGDDDAAVVDALAPDASDAASGADANGPGNPGDICSFNADCAAALRCECNESTGCACQPGVRGTGRNGIDPCPGDNGSDDCASALCIEGPDGTGNFCSDQCTTDADCTGMLPQCMDIALVGRVCVRKSS